MPRSWCCVGVIFFVIFAKKPTVHINAFAIVNGPKPTRLNLLVGGIQDPLIPIRELPLGNPNLLR